MVERTRDIKQGAIATTNMVNSEHDAVVTMWSSPFPMWSVPRILNKDYYREGSVEEISGRESQGA
jgi:hypothetical protein